MPGTVSRVCIFKGMPNAEHQVNIFDIVLGNHLGNALPQVTLLIIMRVVIVHLLILPSQHGDKAMLYIPYTKKLEKKARKKLNPVNTGGVFTTGLRPMSEYASLDPAFDQQAFAEKLSNLYVKMQNAWTDKDIEPLRPYFTDAIFAQMERQLNAYKVKGYTNYVERIAVLSVKTRGVKQSGGEDHIYVELQTRIVDYTLEDAIGNLVSGNKAREKVYDL